MVFRVVLAAALVLLVASGCGTDRSASTRDDEKHIVVRLESSGPLEKLPEGMCFAGLYAYDVMVMADRLHDDRFCARLAARLVPGADQLPWSGKQLWNPDQIVECALTRERTRLLLWRGDPDDEGPRFERAEALTYTMCERLRNEGWKPLDLEKLD
ncbi:MAG TPA: hypothetical protein VGJ40_00835 [Gaiellaceae bacterium]